MRRLPKFSKFTWAGIIVFAVLVAGLWLVEEKFDVRAIHTGYTNSPVAGVRYALITLTNAGHGNITLWPDFFVECEGARNQLWRGHWDQSWITPGGTSRDFVQLPKGMARWRFTALCSPDGFRTELGDHLGTRPEGWSRTLLRDWLHLVPVRKVCTDWIEE